MTHRAIERRTPADTSRASTGLGCVFMLIVGALCVVTAVAVWAAYYSGRALIDGLEGKTAEAPK
jgi:hypothetical protein